MTVETNAISEQVSAAMAALKTIQPQLDAIDAGFVADQAQIDQLLAANASLQNQVQKLTDELLQAQDAQPVGYTEVRPGDDLQALLDNSVPVLIHGTWPETGADLLLPPTGATKIWLGDDADVKRQVTNRNKKQPTGDVEIRGPGRISSDHGGDFLKIWCANLTLMDFTTPVWHNGRWCIPGVDGHLEVTRVHFDCDQAASSGDGGLRVSHCGSGWVHDMIGNSAGDDLYQAVPSGNVNDWLFNKGDVRNLIFQNLHGGRSFDGRWGVEGLQDNFDNGPRNGMKSGIHDVSWIDCDGFSGKSAFVHQNKSSTGSITGTRTKNVTISRKYAHNGQPGEIFLNGVAGTGGIDDVDLGGVNVIDHRETPGEHDHPIFVQQGLVTNVIEPPQAGQ